MALQRSCLGRRVKKRRGTPTRVCNMTMALKVKPLLEGMHNEEMNVYNPTMITTNNLWKIAMTLSRTRLTINSCHA